MNTSPPEFHPDPEWILPPSRLDLTSEEVHVWQASLDRPAWDVERLHRMLSPDEQERAARFHFPRDRNRFIVAHGLLRTILGRYLRLEPGQLRFDRSPYGKPALSTESGEWGLHFNLSHSHRLALFAITRGREIGVDIEWIRREVADGEIAGRYFAAQEITALRALAPEIQSDAFFNCWTRKEAYIKARGEGLSIPLDQFAVTLAPDEPAALLYVQGDHGEASRWTLCELPGCPGYAAAVAVEGRGWRLHCWQWPG